MKFYLLLTLNDWNDGVTSEQSTITLEVLSLQSQNLIRNIYIMSYNLVFTYCKRLKVNNNFRGYESSVSQHNQKHLHNVTTHMNLVNLVLTVNDWNIAETSQK